ncbi:MAG: MASE3 domain-containing protein [Methanosarcinaceae archaeon]|nr:MASE3 domain-containing protein [Methanosarcinaceae archaeon]
MSITPNHNLDGNKDSDNNSTINPGSDNSDQNSFTSGYIRLIEVILGTALLLGLYMTSIYSYLLFHSIVEILGIIVIVSISIIAWHSRRFIDNNYFVFVGIAYLFIAVMTLLHTLAYKGMGVFIGYDSNLPTQLWIATRYVESLTFFIAPFLIGRKLKMSFVLSGYAIVVSILLASIFYWNIFPDCFIEGVGLTAFKIVSEYVISIILLFSIYLLFQKRSKFDTEVLYFLVAALIVNVFAELTFISYISVYGFSNLAGHFLRLISYYLIYKAIIEKALTKPYDLLFRSLKQSEMLLKNSRDFIQTIINSIGDPTIVIDVSDYKILLANDTSQDFNNCENPVEKSMSCYQFNHQRDTPCSKNDHPCPLQLVVNTKKSQRVIHAHYDRYGDESIVDIVATPIFDKNGNVIQIIESSRDMTEIKQTEKALRETRDYLEKLIDYSNAPFIVWNPEFKITRVNHAFERLTGYSSDELIYKKLNILFPDSSMQKTLTEIERTLSGEYWESVEIPILRKDGTIRLTLWNSANLYDEDGTTVLSTIAQGIDITKRKKAEDALRESEERFRLSFEQSAIGMGLMGTDGRWLKVNHALCEMVGYTEQELLAIDFQTITHKDDLDYNLGYMGQMLEGIIYTYQMEKRYIKKDGGIVWGNLSSSLVRYPDGEPMYFISQIENITKRKQAEEALKRYAEKLEHSNEFKDLFTDILRHDLLNPAGIVKGFTEVLLGMEKNEKKLHVLQKIEQNNNRLINLIESAAKFAKLESTDEFVFDVYDIATIFKDVVEDFGPILYEKKIKLDFAAEGKYLANVNPMIEEVFANLLSNAIKYSPNESRIIIDILDSGEKWKVKVTDFGDGISNEDKPKIFTRFKRVGKGGVKGSGLGLAIVKRIIDLHGGDVGVEDNPAGQGSVFWVTLIKAEEY